MISDLTPTIVKIRGLKPKPLPERAAWIINMHKQRLKDPYLRDDTRAQLEHEVKYWQDKLKELEHEQN